MVGVGVALSVGGAEGLLARDPHNAAVIQPYVSGKDLSQRPDCSASRWVINFRDWPLERAEEYPECMEIVRRLVKPERDRNRYSESARERWWLFERSRPELYEAIEGLDHVLAIARVSRALAAGRVPPAPVDSETVIILGAHFFVRIAVL